MSTSTPAVDLIALGNQVRELALNRPELRRLDAQFSRRGHHLYLVGGFLRDLLLTGSPVQDVDLATDARPEQTLAALASLKLPTYDVGKRYGTIGVPCGDGAVEITTFRQDIYQGDDRHPDVTFGDSIEEDLIRRDLTINSMAVSLRGGPLLDPSDGLADLRRKRVRVTGDPQQRFREDPLRLMRVVRFAAQLGFQVDDRTQTAVLESAASLAMISRERIRDEFSKILLSGRAAFGLRLLVELELMAQFAPPVDAMKRFVDESKQQRWKNLLTHTLRVVENTPAILAVRLAALFHDVGKPKTLSVIDGQVHFFEHERVGVTMARQVLTDLRYDGDTIKEVLALIQFHMRPAADTDTWSESAVRRFVREVGEERVERLFALAQADVTSSNPRKVASHLSRLERLVERSRRVIEEMHEVKPESPLDGLAVMVLTGLKPGPAIGQIKNHLLNLVIDGDLAAGDTEGAERHMRAYMAEQGISRER